MIKLFHPTFLKLFFRKQNQIKCTLDTLRMPDKAPTGASAEGVVCKKLQVGVSSANQPDGCPLKIQQHPVDLKCAGLSTPYQ